MSLTENRGYTMSSASFDSALTRLLGHEGGYTNHPADPGGPTQFGITLYDYRKYANKNATVDILKAMRVDEAAAIYRVRYWDALRCDELPAGVDYAVFDYGVNSGIGRSGKVLRRLLDLPDSSGTVTDAVLTAARQADASTLVTAICNERLQFLKSLKTWPVFGKGWGRRIAEVRAAALTMAKQAAAPQATAPPMPAITVTKEQPAARGLFAALMAGLLAAFRRS